MLEKYDYRSPAQVRLVRDPPSFEWTQHTRSSDFFSRWTMAGEAGRINVDFPRSTTPRELYIRPD